MLLFGVDARAVNACKLLDNMMQLAEDVSDTIALSGDASKCEELIDFVKMQVPHIKLALQSYASDLATAQAKIAVLERKVEALTKQFASMQEMMKSSKRRILMGEAAFTLDKVVSEFVMGTTEFTIGELKLMATDLELEPMQAKRWQEFCAFLKRQNWLLGKLFAQSRTLKELRRGDAHSTVEEKAAVSLADLLKWVGEEPLVTAPTECQRFLDLVSKFSEVGKPLLPMAKKKVSEVVNAP